MNRSLQAASESQVAHKRGLAAGRRKHLTDGTCGDEDDDDEEEEELEDEKGRPGIKAARASGVNLTKPVVRTRGDGTDTYLSVDVPEVTVWL